ncbi:RNA polymerase sigma factor RpoH [Magnetococcales bacterium HHB-1]
MNRALVSRTDYGELDNYLNKIRNFSILTEEEEFNLACQYFDHKNRDAAHRLVTSYLHYVVKIAREYSGYGLKMMDLVQEGSIGLMRSVKRFDPYKGFRLATYAVWWIRSAIQEFVLRSWSLVKIATTNEHRKLFFNLRKSKKHIERLDQREAQRIGERLGVRTESVIEMDYRLSCPDDTLNRPRLEDGEDLQNFIPDLSQNQEQKLLLQEQSTQLNKNVKQALKILNEREKFIIQKRIMADTPITLHKLGESLNISRERVRQIEKRALQKLQQHMESHQIT